VSREIGHLVSADGGLAERLRFSIIVDYVVKPLRVGLLATNEDQVLTDNGAGVLEALGGRSPVCLDAIGPFQTSVFGESVLLRVVLSEVKKV